jgi:hypothetical protein
MATSEAGVVGAIWRAIVKEHPDVWMFKTVGNPYQMSGVPDLLVGVAGLLVGLEVKFQRPGESREHALSRATPIQVAQIKKMRAAGCVADVVLDADEALRLVAYALNRVIVRTEADDTYPYNIT